MPVSILFTTTLDFMEGSALWATDFGIVVCSQSQYVYPFEKCATLGDNVNSWRTHPRYLMWLNSMACLKVCGIPMQRPVARAHRVVRDLASKPLGEISGTNATGLRDVEVDFRKPTAESSAECAARVQWELWHIFPIRGALSCQSE